MFALSEFFQSEACHNDEVSSDGGATSISDNEPELQDSEDDVFSAEESDAENVDDRDQIVCDRKWKFIAPKTAEAVRNDPRKCGLTEKSEKVQSIAECFNLYINDEIIDTIIKYTNERASEHYSKQREGSWKPVSRREINAFIGLLLIAGRFRESRENKEHLWQKNTSLTRLIYAAVMSRNRFWDIFRFLRFDDCKTRTERKLTDKLAPIRTVTNIFQRNCKESYEASQQGTVDEQLMSFRGFCPFKVCMPSKPGKYGIKIWTLCDLKTFYCCNFDIYLGKVGNTVETQEEQRVVPLLTDFWKQSGRTVTTDNFFTNISLAESLLKDKLYLVGTMRKDSEDLPKSLTKTSGRSRYSSDFLFTNNVTLVSYVPKRKRCVILLSTVHKEHSISGPEDNYKPDIVSYYNSTKNGVDMLDKLLAEYSCRRATRRWPVALFMHYIDIAAYNAFVVWLTKNPDWESHNLMKSKRKVFLETLARELYTENIEQRATDFENGDAILHRHVATAIEATGRKLIRRRSESSTECRKRSRCYICIGNDNKYATKCTKCMHHVCKQHVIQENIVFCTQCIQIK